MNPGYAYILKKLADLAFAKIGEALRSEKSESDITSETLQVSIEHHIRSVKNWCSEISFADLRRAKQLEDAFVPLDLMLQPKRLRITDEEDCGIRPLEEVLSDTMGHIAILGHPGAGKTTSMKHLCHRLIYDEAFLQGLNIPIVIRLSELKPVETDQGGEIEGADLLSLTMLGILGIEIKFPETASESGRDSKGIKTMAIANRRSIRERILFETLDALGALVILEGLDEAPSITVRESIVQQVRRMANNLDNSRIILTSRTGEFSYHIEGMVQYEISPLAEEQVKAFATRWLGDSDGERLVQQIRISPFVDTAIRPLTLAHLCAIYERIGSIPEKPKTVYRKIVSLLLEKWDEQRSIKRTSAYASFEIDRKLDFLAHLAYVLTCNFHATRFSKTELLRAYGQIYDSFSLPRGEAPKVIAELESHTGLFLESGAEIYEFSHKSLQEYLSAEFIVRLPNIPDQSTNLLELPNELAIAVAISSRPSEYLRQLMLCLGKSTLPLSFLGAFVSRLLLERPDFENASKASIGLLSLYSRYVHAHLRTNRGNERRIETVGREIEGLSKLLLSRLSWQEIQEKYTMSEYIEDADREKIYLLIKSYKNPFLAAALKVDLLADWPSPIWIFESITK